MVYTFETIGARAEERGLRPGDRIWVAGDVIEDNAFRAGNSPGNPAIYLRWKDIGIDEKKGPIKTEEEMMSGIVNPGQGLSMFIEKVVHSNFNLLDTSDDKLGKGALKRLAMEAGYDKADQIHWFKLKEGKVMPSGLEMVFDNHPPGHCTLTVTRAMTVYDFMNLISEHLGFEYIGTDIFGIRLS
jgi:hypothetical protein